MALACLLRFGGAHPGVLMKHLTPLALALFLLTGCVGGLETWTVDANKQPCWGMGPELCLGYTLDDGSRDSMIGSPTGFEFQWGVVQTIQVQVTPIPNPPADGSSLDRELISVIDSQDVADGATFALNLGDDHLSAGSPGQFSLLGTTVNVPDATLEQSIADALDADETLTITFEYGDGDTLIAVSVD